ncbi:MAG: hypothetical protein IPL79_18210 [Myxococcales bacterium]|nr:hypothetical protein [Myxococcales bacterium]
MTKYVLRIALLLAGTAATLSWQQTASACGGGGDDGEILALAGLVLVVEAAPIGFGAADLAMAAKRREPSATYGVLEATLSVPALILNTAVAVEIFEDANEDFGTKLMGVAIVALPTLTFVHGVKWAVNGRRRTRERPATIHTGPPGLHATLENPTAALAESRQPQFMMQLATMPVSDGKSIGAGVGAIGRF